MTAIIGVVGGGGGGSTFLKASGGNASLSHREKKRVESHFISAYDFT